MGQGLILGFRHDFGWGQVCGLDSFCEDRLPAIFADVRAGR